MPLDRLSCIGLGSHAVHEPFTTKAGEAPIDIASQQKAVQVCPARHASARPSLHKAQQCLAKVLVMLTRRWYHQDPKLNRARPSVPNRATARPLLTPQTSQYLLHPQAHSPTTSLESMTGEGAACQDGHSLLTQGHAHGIHRRHTTGRNCLVSGPQRARSALDTVLSSTITARATTPCQK